MTAVSVDSMMPPMADLQLVSVIVRGLSARLKGKIVKRAERDGLSMRALVRQVLCRNYDVHYIENKTGGRTGKDWVEPTRRDLVTKIPAAVNAKIDADAYRRRMSKSDVMREILCAEFNEPFRPGGRWPAKDAA